LQNSANLSRAHVNLDGACGKRGIEEKAELLVGRKASEGMAGRMQAG